MCVALVKKGVSFTIKTLRKMETGEVLLGENNESQTIKIYFNARKFENYYPGNNNNER